jgi:hypothetical protein
VIPQTSRQVRQADVDHYMRRYLPRVVELGTTAQNIAKNVTRDALAARQLMKEMQWKS